MDTQAMRLSILTAVCGAIDITEQWFAETVANCETSPEVVIVSNGNTDEEVARLQALTPHVLVFPEPMGSTKAFNAGLKVCTGDIVAMLHNDLMLKQRGWDRVVLGAFEADPEHTIGIAGIHGAAQLGSPSLYREPYQMMQLARALTFSNLVDAESHGARVDVPREAVVLDGMFLAARRDDLTEWGGFDENMVHHMHDIDLAINARAHGRRNLFLPLVAHHLNGQTANMPRYNDNLRAQGVDGDAEIHRRSHEYFWAKWQGTGQLPARCN